MSRFNIFWNSHFTISENKTFESELIYSDTSWFKFQFSWSRKQDHAGLSLTMGLFGYAFCVKMHDNRHWDHEKNCWYNYSSESQKWDLT
jgi:hypothetical protein